jgi:hypothetical protein
MFKSIIRCVALAPAPAMLGAASGLSAAAAHHPAAVHHAAASSTVSAWLKLCDKDELQCENRLLKAPMPNLKCIPEDDVDSYVLTPKVRAWFAANPKHNSDSINAGIDAALADIYPCKT